MHLKTLLDVEMIAVETKDELSILLELQAPESETQAARPPHTLQVVLDRSGSMSGGALEAAKAALDELIGRLDAKDRFGLVTFDSAVEVVVPSGPLTDRDAVRRAIATVEPRGMTDLASGLIRGIEEARRTKGDGGATVLLLSDGHANRGHVDHDQLGTFATAVRREGISIGVVGIGLGYDEDLLSAVAAGGAGNVHFAEEADAVGGALAAEVDGLLDQVVQAATLTVRPGTAVQSVTLFNDLPVSEVEGGFLVELGNFVAGEERKLLLQATIPALRDLGLAEVCGLTMRWTETATLKQQTVELPIHVGVVPGDAAAGRIPNPVVRTEVAFQKAQRSRKDAADALRYGDVQGGSDIMRLAAIDLQDAMAGAPPELADELAVEADLLMSNSIQALIEPVERSIKNQRAEYYEKTNKRQSMANMERRENRRRARDEERRRTAGEAGDTTTDQDPGEGKFGG
ncbi:VWA domain-containing protein [Patulibacter sp.]|uniref:vWA domain-containing protein n=1 Tax=Patulibacter sp. TaxID=1912859 RepID=UPI002725DCDC|nr:VWA domain-containing protein [Patulibacter sp.]MDO9410113.1 VWA domain-containing protein [Patulibacter sp.]